MSNLFSAEAVVTDSASYIKALTATGNVPYDLYHKLPTNYLLLGHEIIRRLLLGRKVMTNLDTILTSRHYFANKGLTGQDYGFSACHLWM